MMTEEEARTKWCPMARVVGSVDMHDGPPIGGNRVGHPWRLSPFEEQCRCIASECMAWRSVMDMRDASSDHGYCGLAGRP